MNKRSRYLFISFISLFFSITLVVVYLFETKSLESLALEKKRDFVLLTQLPDLALSTESYALRHRSLSNIADLYAEDGSLREYTKGSFSQEFFYKDR